MGTFGIKIEIGDLHGHRFEELDALVDTGATTTMAPRSILESLDITPTKSQVFEYANGEHVELDMAPVTVVVDGMPTPTWVIFGEEGSIPLLGAHALEGLLLGVDPYGQGFVPIIPPVHVHGLLA